MVFVGGIAGTFFAVLHVFQAYFDYAVSTTVSLEFDSFVDFPSVTVCNQVLYHMTTI